MVIAGSLELSFRVNLFSYTKISDSRLLDDIDIILAPTLISNANKINNKIMA